MRRRTLYIYMILAFMLTVKLHAQPVDPNATIVTRALYKNLMEIQRKDSVIFGQYYATWRGVESDNDILDMTGKQPGVTEWHIPFMVHNYQGQLAQIRKDFNNGLLTSFFWRMNNPITDNPETDLTDGNGGPIDISTLLPGGIYHHLFLVQLDKWVAINNDLPKINGEPMPVSFRFLPEMSVGTVRWYKHCTPEEFRILWISAFNYLTFTKGCNNLLWHFDPNNVESVAEYLEYYPGHDYIDICGRNIGSGDYLMDATSTNSMKYAITVAAEENKIVAISQMNSYNANGDWNRNGITDEGEPASIPNWWTEVWLDKVYTKDKLLNKIAFSCAWQNRDHLNYFLPFMSHDHKDNFVDLCNRPEILLAPDLDLYDTTSVPLLDELKVTVQVIDSRTKEPVYFASVSGNERVRFTSTQGEAYFLTEDYGYWQYSVENEGYFSLSDSTIIIKDTTLVIELTQKLANVSLQMIDEVAGEPIPGCLIAFEGQNYVCNGQGINLLENLPHGTYGFVASADNYISSEFTGIQIDSDTSLIFSLIYDYPELTIRVIDRSNGEPVYRAVVDHDNQQTFTNTEGLAEIGGVSQQNYVFTVDHSDYFILTDSAEINADTTFVIELTPKRADITFEVLNADGPLSNVNVTLDGYSVISDPSGIVYFFNKPARKQYAYQIEEEGYFMIVDTFLLELDTTIILLLEQVTGVGHTSSGLIKVFPNPACDKLFVNTQIPNTRVRIITPDGRLLLEKIIYSKTAEINVSELIGGCYYLQVRNSQQNAMIKIIIDRNGY